jgi:hypothetical protein
VTFLERNHCRENFLLVLDNQYLGLKYPLDSASDFQVWSNHRRGRTQTVSVMATMLTNPGFFVVSRHSMTSFALAD